MRGKGKFKSLKPGPVAINLNYLNLLPDKAEVTTSLLVKKKIVKEKDALRYGVKILGTGQVNKSLKVLVPCSRGAEKAIGKAGGSVVAGSKEKKPLKKSKPEKVKKTGRKKAARNSQGKKKK